MPFALLKGLCNAMDRVARIIFGRVWRPGVLNTYCGIMALSAIAIIKPQPGSSMSVKWESREQGQSIEHSIFFHSLTSTGDTGALLLSQDPLHFVLIFHRCLIELGLSSWLLQWNVSRESVRNALLAYWIPHPAAWNWLETFLAFEINNLKMMLSLLLMTSFCLQK